MKKLNGLMALALTGMLSTGAFAAPVVEWSYEVSSKWIEPTTFTDEDDGVEIVTDTEISWGGDNNGDAPGVGDLTIGGSRSGVLIEGSPKSGSIVTDVMTPQPTNTFSHVNNPIAASFSTLLTATIETTLQLTPVNPAGAPRDAETITFSVNFSETPNTTGGCVEEATSICDDIFVISFGSLNNDFVYEGFQYFVSIVKTTGPLDSLSAATCAVAGAPADCLGFVTREGAKTSVDFGILITSKPLLVSEPGALALAGLGLLGLGLSLRRKAA